MSFNANDRESGGNFTPAEALEAGSYPGRLVQIILLGLQPRKPFKGKDKPPVEMMYLGYELSHEFLEDEDGEPDTDKPRWVGEDLPFYNLDADRAKSTLRYHAIDPKGIANGDWSQLGGYPCNITLSKEPSSKYKGSFVNYVSDVGQAVQVPGYEQPELVNPVKLFDLEEPDMDVFFSLPEWLQEKIKSNLNYEGSILQEKVLEANTDVPKSNTKKKKAPPAPPPNKPKAPTPPAPKPPSE